MEVRSRNDESQSGREMETAASAILRVLEASPPSARIEAMAAFLHSVRRLSPEQREALAEKLRERIHDPKLMLVCRNALLHSPAAVEETYALARGSDEAIAVSAVRMLGLMPYPRVEEHLLHLMNSRNKALRLAALEAAIFSDLPSAVEMVVENCTRWLPEEHVQAAFTYLERGTVEAVLERLEKGDDRAAASRAAYCRRRWCGAAHGTKILPARRMRNASLSAPASARTAPAGAAEGSSGDDEEPAAKKKRGAGTFAAGLLLILGSLLLTMLLAAAVLDRLSTVFRTPPPPPAPTGKLEPAAGGNPAPVPPAPGVNRKERTR